eukprot:TRINITY_DN31483_c0_g1_i1.p1 TRINITY_DN31483_c0_g1~~TRINITY_DN31483_c0_g1_i1.p1  ORF type:complete len:163 (-),score=43.80 TRINITY_DN31483_c0_g1_i1:60-491(-)
MCIRDSLASGLIKDGYTKASSYYFRVYLESLNLFHSAPHHDVFKLNISSALLENEFILAHLQRSLVILYDRISDADTDEVDSYKFNFVLISIGLGCVILAIFLYIWNTVLPKLHSKLLAARRSLRLIPVHILFKSQRLSLIHI